MGEASTMTRSSRLHQPTLETSTMTRILRPDHRVLVMSMTMRSSLRKITNCRGPTMTICACRMQARTHTVLAFKTRSTMTNIRIRSLQGNLSTLTKVCLIRLERGQSCATRDISQLEARPGSDRLGEKATKKIHIQMQNRQRSRRCLAVREASHLSRSRALMCTVAFFFCRSRVRHPTSCHFERVLSEPSGERYSRAVC